MIQIPDIGPIEPRGQLPIETDPGGQTFSLRTVEPHLTVDGPFWISDREIPVDVFEEFINDDTYASEDKPTAWSRETRHGFVSSADHPVSNVLWNDAVLFCNWLSWKEGRKPCYRRAGRETLSPEYVEGHVEFQVWELELADGYRVPLESEWEYACRAGTVTYFSCGDNYRLLHDYAVVGGRDLPKRCASKRPNGYGLFDMEGNVFEWSTRPGENFGGVRGGSCGFPASSVAIFVRASIPFEQFISWWGRKYKVGDMIMNTAGFRVARNVSP